MKVRITNEPLVKVDWLGRAIASEEIRDKMDVEDEIDRIFERGIQKITLEKDKIIAEKDQQLALANQQTKKEKQKAENAQQQAEQERQKNKALLEELEALKKLIQPTP